jgi:hypothetical protein
MVFLVYFAHAMSGSSFHSPMDSSLEYHRNRVKIMQRTSHDIPQSQLGVFVSTTQSPKPCFEQFDPSRSDKEVSQILGKKPLTV